MIAGRAREANRSRGQSRVARPLTYSLFLAASWPAFAQDPAGSARPTEIDTPAGTVTLVPNQDAAPAGDLLTPQNLLQLEYQVKTTNGLNSEGDPRTVTTDTFKLRGDVGIRLDSDSQLILRGDLPYLAKNPVTDSNPGGDFVYGFGDADLQAAVIHQLTERWAFGAGLRVIMPTGGSTFGSDTWRAMPIAGARYTMPEIGRGAYFEPLMRYEVSFAGDPSARRSAICNSRRW